MKAVLTVEANVNKPLDGATAMFLACLQYLKKMNVTSLQFNGDGDVIIENRNIGTSYVSASDLPEIPQMIPHAKAVTP